MGEAVELARRPRTRPAPRLVMQEGLAVHQDRKLTSAIPVGDSTSGDLEGITE